MNDEFEMNMLENFSLSVDEDELVPVIEMQEFDEVKNKPKDEC